jgi:hypothetical protein
LYGAVIVVSAATDRKSLRGELLSIELAGYRADEIYTLDHVLAAYEQGENLVHETPTTAP